MRRHVVSGKNRWIRVIVLILVALLLVGAIGIIWKCTNGGSEKFSTFYLSYDGEDIEGSGNTVIVAAESESHFRVKRLFGSVGADEYSVKILTNAQNSADRFYYTVDGEGSFYRSGIDVTEAFDIIYDGDNFTLTVPASMEDILKTVLRSEEVGSSEREVHDVAYFRLIVVSSGQEVVQADLKITGFILFTSYPSGLFELDKKEIVF